MGWTIGVQVPAEAMIGRVQTALGSTQRPIQWVQGQSGRGLKLTTHLHLVPGLRMGGTSPSLPRYGFMAWCLIKHSLKRHTSAPRSRCA